MRQLREEVLEAALRSYRCGLVKGTSGNWSARDARTNLVAVTPTSLPYEDMTVEDIVIVDLDGRVVDGIRRPTSETPMHTAIYRALPQVGGIAHTHSPYASAFAVLNHEIPGVLIEMAYVGGASVPVVPFAPPGTEALGRSTLEVLRARRTNVVLLANHGVLAIGRTLQQACLVATMVEDVAHIYHLALQVGEPRLIDEDTLRRLAAQVGGPLANQG